MKSEIEDKRKVILENYNGLQYVKFYNFEKHKDMVKHCFTTRKGGVSVGECDSLNMGFNRKDERQNVLENYRRISNALGIDSKNMVFSNQVHDNKIKVVSEKDRGKGIIIENDIIGFDGLITDKKDVALVTFYADCVPIFFFDPVKKVIGIAHSGWRGTVKEIAKVMINMFRDNYGSRVEDIETAIGPSIGKCCFEVGEEVHEEFIDVLVWAKEYCLKEELDKWYIDLQAIIKKTLLNSGILEDKICLSGICTKCNKDLFFSHRGYNGKTGSLAALMQLV